MEFKSIEHAKVKNKNSFFKEFNLRSKKINKNLQITSTLNEVGMSNNKLQIYRIDNEVRS